MLSEDKVECGNCGWTGTHEQKALGKKYPTWIKICPNCEYSHFVPHKMNEQEIQEHIHQNLSAVSLGQDFEIRKDATSY